MITWWAIQAIILALGLSIGSFLNVCIARMPEDRSIISPPSHCPHCGAFIRWYDNIPVLSWIFLRAKCRSCKYPIAPTYPLIETATGLLILMVWQQFIANPFEMTPARLLAFVFYTIFVSMLMGLTFIDLKHGIIPDEFSIYAVPIGILGCYGIGLLEPGLIPSWQGSLLGAFLGGGSLLFIYGAYWLLTRKEGMGLGDVKLLAMIGAFLGPFPALLIVLMVSAIAGSIVGIGVMIVKGGGLKTAFPFGPFLAIAALAQLFFGEELFKSIFTGLATFVS